MKFNNKLINPFFIVSIFVLMLNDFVLKSMFHNAITGKLSDFAWLFAMPFFLSIFNPKLTKNIHFFVALFFIFWKSELSQPAINWFNSIGFNFYRVVDFTDNICLISVLLSYFIFQNQKPKLINPVLGILSIAISSFAFIADTQKREWVEPTALELLEGKLKQIQFKNVSQEQRVVIINFKYTKTELENSTIVYKDYNKIDTLIINQQSDLNFVTPICENEKVIFPKSFNIVVKDTLGKIIETYNKNQFLEYEKQSKLENNKKEIDENYWYLEIGYKKTYIDEEDVIGKWKKISGKFHYDFELDHIHYKEDDYLKEGNLLREYKDNTLIVNFSAGKSYGKVTRLKNDSLTINWNNKDVVNYVKW